MKKSFLVALGLSIIAISTMAAEWQNSLKPKGEKTLNIVLAKNGQSAYKILLPLTPTLQEQKAAKMLQKYLAEISGAEFKLIKESQVPVDGNILSIGQTKLYKKSGIIVDKDLQEVGYSIASKNGNLFFTGGKRRGPINAVIAFLEEDLGCRWYASDSKAQLPSEKLLTAVVTPRSYVPVLKVRDPFYWDAFNPNWALMNRTNPAWLGGVPKNCGGAINFPRAYFVHTFAKLLPAKTYFKTHPEYFAMQNGKRVPDRRGKQAAHLCLTNPDVVDIVADNVCKVLAKNPDTELISVSQNDGRKGFCQCPKCTALNEKEGSVSGSLISFINKVAAKVKVKYPNVKICTLAYMESFQPPKNIKPADNVIIRLCTDTHIWRNPFFYVTETEGFSNALKAWAKTKADITLWDYTVNFSNYLMPFPNLQVIDKNLKTYLNNRVQGIMFQGSYQSPGGARAPLRCWVLAKKLWNPDLKMDDLVKDFTYGYFGPAGNAMQQYNELLHSEWQKFHDNNKPGSRFKFSKAFLPEARKLFDIAIEKSKGSSILLSRIQREELALLYYRLEQGPMNKADKQAYLDDLNKFARYMNKFKVTHLIEDRGGVKAKFMIWRGKAAMAGYIKTSPGTLTLALHEVKFWPSGKYTPKMVKDEKSPCGIAIRQPGNNKNWSVQWNQMRTKPFAKDTVYVVRVHCRIDKKADTGKV